MSNQIKVDLQDTMGSDRAIAEAAWTSSTEHNTLNKLIKARTEMDVQRVVNMLADLKHSTPFESVVLRFWIKMPIATDRQFMTHRLQSSSGMSGRYRTMPSEYLDIQDDIGLILDKVVDDLRWPNPRMTLMDPITEYINICEQANNFYSCFCTSIKQLEKQDKITNSEMKRLREFFRGVLPQHNMTERVSIMNLRAFANFYKLRSKSDAQPEIREVAELMLKAIKESNIAPVALEALERNSWVI